jgi:methylmalonyl-CoA mutase cobalamin-binding domain/chain
VTDPQRLYQAILDGDQKTSIAVTRETLAEGVAPLELITTYMIPAMDEVGRRFECQDYFVPELLLSGRAMKGALELLRPLLAASGVQPAGRVVIGTVKGDLHDIGKNLVASMLEGGGFEVVDLGADVSPEKFIEAVRERNANIVCLSALLTVTMPSMKTTIQALDQAGLRDKVRIMVGGAPVTSQYAGAVALARNLLAGN